MYYQAFIHYHAHEWHIFVHKNTTEDMKPDPDCVCISVCL